jgi:hypothetical protein
VQYDQSKGWIICVDVALLVYLFTQNCLVPLHHFLVMEENYLTWDMGKPLSNLCAKECFKEKKLQGLYFQCHEPNLLHNPF